MSTIYDWVKNLVFYYIMMTAVLHLLPNNNYQKYVRFFGGLLLVVILLNPILEFFDESDYLLNKISYESFWQEMDSVRLDVSRMEEAQQRAFRKEYEEAIADDIVLMAENNALKVLSAEVELTEDYTLEYIEVSVIPEEQAEGIHIEKIRFSDNSSEYPGVSELKTRIRDFYGVSEEQIRIVVQEG